MTYDVYMMIFEVGRILTIIMLVVSLIVFFILKIPIVIDEIFGITKKRAIENIRKQNEEFDEVNKEHGKLKDKISSLGTLQSNRSDNSGFTVKMENRNTQKLINETIELNHYAGKNLLQNETPVYKETSLLSSNVMKESGTADFGNTCELPPLPGTFAIEQEITFIHTEEIIPVG